MAVVAVLTSRNLMMFRLVMRWMRCDSRSGRLCQRFWNEEFRIVNVELGRGDRLLRLL